MIHSFLNSLELLNLCIAEWTFAIIQHMCLNTLSASLVLTRDVDSILLLETTQLA